jgi:hypothetical protein
VILETIIDSKPKQEYLDEATKKLEVLKAKQGGEKVQPEESKDKELKLQYKESKKDEDLFDKMYKESQEKNTPVNTGTTQPK